MYPSFHCKCLCMLSLLPSKGVLGRFHRSTVQWFLKFQLLYMCLGLAEGVDATLTQVLSVRHRMLRLEDTYCPFCIAKSALRLTTKSFQRHITGLSCCHPSVANNVFQQRHSIETFT